MWALVAVQRFLITPVWTGLDYWIMFRRLESRSKWMVLIFALASPPHYSALAGVYPITVIEALWALVAVQRFLKRHQLESGRA